MAILASDKGGGDFKPVPEGQAVGICDMMVDLGLQDGGSFGPKHKVYIRFQVPEHRVQYTDRDGVEQDKPAVIGVQFTVSLSDKSNLRPFLEGWRGKRFTGEEVREFDITTIAGKPALLNIVHEAGEGRNAGKTFANIASIMPVPKGMPKPELEGEVIVHDDDNDRYNDLPEWLQKKIDAALDEDESTTTTNNRPQPAAFDTDLDDDIPF
jgi:hypothetical protein